jgi:hypothetical protein
MRCDADGGTGIGAGHVCLCTRASGHPDDAERPHGCECGAMWSSWCMTPACDRDSHDHSRRDGFYED